MVRLPYVTEDLVKRLLTDPDPEERRSAARALGDINDPENAVPVLVHALCYEHVGKVLDGIADALAKYRTHAVPVLIDLLNDEDWRVRARSAWALGQIGDPQAIHALACAVHDRMPMVGRMAAMALKWIGRISGQS